MLKTDPRIDAYINKAAAFAEPILKHIRELVHKACPNVQETIKWSMPYFDYKGSALCGMASFKQHCALVFWKASLMKDPEGILQIKEREAMGHFAKITSLKDLPSDKILIAYIKEAGRLNEENIKLPSRQKADVKKKLDIPAELIGAFLKNKKAQTAFDKFTPGKKKEYIEWLTNAKTEATKTRRLATALEWIAEGKSLNWRYEKC